MSNGQTPVRVAGPVAKHPQTKGARSSLPVAVQSRPTCRRLHISVTATTIALLTAPLASRVLVPLSRCGKIAEVAVVLSFDARHTLLLHDTYNFRMCEGRR